VYYNYEKVHLRKNLFVQDLLINLRGFQSIDPRDKVFAVLGMACNANDAVFSPTTKFRLKTFLLKFVELPWFEVQN
jgi:hypothetical protein